eukprot:930499_1
MTAQGYTTIGDTVYLWGGTSTGYLSTFNINTMAFEASAIAAPDSAWNPCLTQIDDRYLIALGGTTGPLQYYNTFRIYDTVQGQWLTEGPTMTSVRHGGTCDVATDLNGKTWMYAMAGQGISSAGTGHLWTVERIEVSDMININSG